MVQRKEIVRRGRRGIVAPLAVEAMERAWDLEEVPEGARDALFHAYLMAARAGRVEAMTNAGLHLLYGDGVPQDVRHAFRWMRKAAGLGDGVAAFNLALSYEKGPCIRPNRRLAEYWYRRAVSLGFPPARMNLAALLVQSSDKEKLKESVALYRESARLGNVKALLYVAFAYEQGRGVRKNLGRAIQIYKKAADAGNADAQCVLGWMCLNGVGGSTDILGALRWYQQSAEQGNASALFSLGQMYGEGNGVPKSRTRAARYLRLAAALGHSRSADYLKELGFEV